MSEMWFCRDSEWRLRGSERKKTVTWRRYEEIWSTVKFGSLKTFTPNDSSKSNQWHTDKEGSKRGMEAARGMDVRFDSEDEVNRTGDEEWASWGEGAHTLLGLTKREWWVWVVRVDSIGVSTQVELSWLGSSLLHPREKPKKRNGWSEMILNFKMMWFKG